MKNPNFDVSSCYVTELNVISSHLRTIVQILSEISHSLRQRTENAVHIVKIINVTLNKQLRNPPIRDNQLIGCF